MNPLTPAVKGRVHYLYSLCVFSLWDIPPRHVRPARVLARTLGALLRLGLVGVSEGTVRLTAAGLIAASQ